MNEFYGEVGYFERLDALRLTGLIKIPAAFVPFSDKENRPGAVFIQPEIPEILVEIKWNGPFLFVQTGIFRGTHRQFSENICSEDDLRSRTFRTFVVKFLACRPLLGFSRI